MKITFTVEAEQEEQASIEIYVHAPDMFLALDQIREMLRHRVKYQSERLAEMNGLDAVEELQSEIWEVLPEIVRG